MLSFPKRWLRFAALALFLAPLGVAQAEAQYTVSLPDYVVEEFGQPPLIPTGELNSELRNAVKVAFVDSVTQQTWGNDQFDALEVIEQSGDPRVVWIIARPGHLPSHTVKWPPATG